MPRPEDSLVLIFPTPPGLPEAERPRWWRIRQPPPLVAFALQGQVAAALGAAGAFAVEALFADPDQAEDFEGERELLGEALALRTLRRSRAGQPIAALGEAREAAPRLWAVLRAAAARAGGGLDALLLLGSPERVKDSPSTYRWGRPSLLQHLLLYSELQFDGEGKGPRPAPVDPARITPKDPLESQQAVALRQAVLDGSPTAFAKALDAMLVGPDEAALLSTWAVLHLIRPF